MDDTTPPPFTGEPAAWTAEGIRALGAFTDLRTTAEILGFTRNTAYEMIRAATFPVPVIRAGTKYRVSVAAILRLVHADADHAAPATPAAAPPAPAPIRRRRST
ncbi:MAG TPA: DNA-binding protein [Rugosimonospora sp.]|nr:DNA-binding protein [Rugosimonospora sp.]